ncbi:MAG: hypothetical protein JW827_11180 [Spirochaetes bacterium]|nr:hypothetical protein [Spirochaetota bacterium]
MRKFFRSWIHPVQCLIFLSLFLIHGSLLYSKWQKNIGLTMGPGLFGLSDVNQYIDQQAQIFEADGYHASTEKYTAGMIFGLCTDFSIGSSFILKPKIETFNYFSAEANGNRSTTVLLVLTEYEKTYEVSSSLTLASLGLYYTIGQPEDLFSFSFGVSGGYGVASSRHSLLSETTSYALLVPITSSSEYSFSMNGSCPVLEIEAGIKLYITSFLSLEIMPGYRYAYVRNMKISENVPELNAQSGQPLKDSNSKTVNYDFSGMTEKIVIHIKF